MSKRSYAETRVSKGREEPCLPFVLAEWRYDGRDFRLVVTGKRGCADYVDVPVAVVEYRGAPDAMGDAIWVQHLDETNAHALAWILLSERAKLEPVSTMLGADANDLLRPVEAASKNLGILECGKGDHKFPLFTVIGRLTHTIDQLGATLGVEPGRRNLQDIHGAARWAALAAAVLPRVLEAVGESGALADLGTDKVNELIERLEARGRA